MGVDRITINRAALDAGRALCYMSGVMDPARVSVGRQAAAYVSGQSKSPDKGRLAKVMRCGLYGLSRAFLSAMGMVSLVACAAVTLPGSAAAQVFSTVGVYDEPIQANDVDFVAAGSTLSFSQFKSDVTAAFTNDFGGVNQCYAIGGNAGPYTFSYGVNQAKRLNMTGATNNEIGITASSSFIQSISEIGVWATSRPEMTFFLGDVSSSVANEAVIKFGLTIVSTTFFSLGDVTATATFSGGGKTSASRFISEAAGLGDTFFGFTAPTGQSILFVTFTNSAGRPMFFDDIGFITAVIPSLTISRNGPSQVRVSWPTNATGFSLELTTSLPPQIWTPDTNSPAVFGDQFTVIVDPTVGRRFYRLRAP